VPLRDRSSREELQAAILNTFGGPPDEVRDGGESLPGVYILWCPPSEAASEVAQSIAGKIGNKLQKVLQAAQGNGLLYIGQSKHVPRRVWNHTQNRGADVTRAVLPHKLVAVNWQAPDIGLRNLEDMVGRQVVESVETSGYDLVVDWG
jgi:hypothetical protein